MKCKVILHIGYPKTGTTFLQKVLAFNRKNFLETGNCYHNSKGDCHWRFIIPFYENAQDYNPVKRALRRGSDLASIILDGENELDNFLTEINQSEQVILSAEHFYFQPEVILRKIHQFFVDNDLDTRVICFVREPRSLRESQFNQSVKQGLMRMNDVDKKLQSFGEKRNISRFVSIFGDNNVSIFDYSSLKKTNEALIEFFCDQVGLDYSRIKFPEANPIRYNSSLSLEALGVIDIINGIIDEPPNSANRLKLFHVLSRIKGSKFHLSQQQVLQLQKNCHEDMLYLKNEWGINHFEQLGMEDL